MTPRREPPAVKRTGGRQVSEGRRAGAGAGLLEHAAPRPQGWLAVVMQTCAVPSEDLPGLTSPTSARCQALSTHHPDLFLRSCSHQLKLRVYFCSCCVTPRRPAPAEPRAQPGPAVSEHRGPEWRRGLCKDPGVRQSLVRGETTRASGFDRTLAQGILVLGPASSWSPGRLALLANGTSAPARA